MKWSMSVVSKVLAFSLLLSACMGGAAMPASAEPADDGPAAVQDLQVAGETLVPNSNKIAGATLTAREGITLRPGEKIRDEGAISFDLLEDANKRPTGMRVEWNSYNVYAKVAYEIGLFGQHTDNWLQIYITTAGNVWPVNATCEIFEGKPGTPGAGPVWSSPFQCETKRAGLDNDWAFTVDTPGVIAETSGTISTVGTVSLSGRKAVDFGYYFVKNPDWSVGASSSTRFDSVLRESDMKRVAHRGAEVDFRYDILDNGLPTEYWLLVKAETRTAIKDGHYAFCSVMGGRQDDVPADFGCKVVRTDVSATHRDYFMEVSKRD